MRIRTTAIEIETRRRKEDRRGRGLDWSLSLKEDLERVRAALADSERVSGLRRSDAQGTQLQGSTAELTWPLAGYARDARIEFLSGQDAYKRSMVAVREMSQWRPTRV